MSQNTHSLAAGLPATPASLGGTLNGTQGCIPAGRLFPDAGVEKQEN